MTIVEVIQLLGINKLSFQNKMKIVLLTITTISILSTGIYAYWITSNILERNAIKLTQDSVVKSAQTADEKLQKLMLIMMTFMISQEFKDMLQDVSQNNSDKYYTHLSNLDNVFSQARIAEPLIHSIYVSTPIGDFYPLSINRNHGSSFFDSELYNRFQEVKKTVWIEGHEDMLFTGRQRVVSLVLDAISDQVYPVKDVYVVVNIREEGLRQLIDPKTESGAVQFLINAKGNQVYIDNDPLIEAVAGSDPVMEIVNEGISDYQSIKLSGETYLLNYAPLRTSDWTIVSVQSKSHVLKDLVYIKWMIVLIIGISIIVTVLLSEAFTRTLLRPLKRLQFVMRQVEDNDLSARFTSNNQDEIAQVGLRFNRMLEQIERLIEEVKQAEASKRGAEIKSLSAQMDPHFLYNTLNTIYWKLKLNQVEPSKKMVVALSRLFQLGLNKGQEMSTLDKEIEHVRQYLELQSDCYEQLFTYEIRVHQPALLELAVPRLILQPLVENSILHGFGNMEYGGLITIDVESQEEHRWVIRVRDNGCGMDASTLHLDTADIQHGGYAIRNLISRFQLYYGDQTTFMIDSKPDQGTTVTISIPFEGDDVHA